MAEGGTFGSFMGSISQCRKTGYLWADKHQEFKQAKDIAYAKHELWAITQMKNGMFAGKAFNPVVWIFMMKNMHGWRDKIEVSEAEEREAEFSYDR